MKLHLAENLALPASAVTETFLVVGKRGSGKSNTCVRLAEQFFAAKLPFVAIDPTDTWFGIKAAKDGKGPGLGVYIFGGRHADLPLEPTGGQLAADVVIDSRISAVFSVKHFSGRERSRFVSDFCDRLFRRNTEPLHVFLEEAHEVAPQSIQFKGQGDEEMLGRVTRIWKLGRSSGLGGSAITQRPASLSKNITTQAEILIVHRMLGPQDVAAVKEWIKYHEQSDEILAQLSSLKTGEAFFWAPDFPEDRPIGLKRVQVLERETFDSAATPKAGHRHTEPKELAPVNLDAIAAAMKDTIERAKAEDPRELRKKIAELERELRTMPAIPHIIPNPERVEVPVPVLTEPMVRQVGLIVERVEQGMREQIKALGAFSAQVKNVPHEAAKAWQERTGAPATALYRKPPSSEVAKRQGPVSREGNGKDVPAGDLADTQQRILDTIAMIDVRGIETSRQSVARWMGLHPNGGRYLTDIARLRERGLLEEKGMALTSMGLAQAGTIETGEKAALEAAERKKPGCRAVLKAVLEAKGPLTRVELAARLDIHPNGGRYLTNLARLREMGLIPPKGEIVATEGTFR